MPWLLPSCLLPFTSKLSSQCVCTLSLTHFIHSLTWNIYQHAAAAAAKSLQSCPTLCDPIDGSPPGSPVPGILQARTLERVAISFSRRNITQHNKNYMRQTHSKHYPQWWKTESISPKVRNKTRVPTFTTTIQHSFGSFSHSNQSRKRNKRNSDWKRRSKTLTVCRWHDPL